ncbi:MAG TPA: ankyrin repeat domain-containing protein [Vicinamibacterales bacterium]|nr:ankyrin repeat domain-containing protein [Vicinamibacterales bacterium]
MSDALPLPPRPNLERYRRLAKDLQRACRSGDDDTIRGWAAGWIAALARLAPEAIDVREDGALERAAGQMTRRWHQHTAAHPHARKCLLTGAQFFVAREHGFATWSRFVDHLAAIGDDSSAVSVFEQAVDAIVDGDLDALQALVAAHPGLVRARSTREHRSTLLHYVSANGVEDFRQRTPQNIVAITNALLRAGADVNAESEAYGGRSTTLGLAATSVHPEQAGVQIALLETLLAHGARIDQPGLAGNGHSAIRGCLANGQGGAARFFADRGVPMALDEAAGVGRLDAVRRYVDGRGDLQAGATRERLQEGFLYACGYGHADIVKYLLERLVDPGFANGAGETGLHWAMYGPHPRVVEVLLAHRAPVRATDRQGATAIDWAVNGWAQCTEPGEVGQAVEVIAMVARAGGRLTLSWFEQNERRGRSLARARQDVHLRSLLGDGIATRDMLPDTESS